jgi:ligand-binding SRPBCC domain-containing protein
MTHIHLETIINAPIERCFDLSRSIDLHKLSMKQTGEKAIDGRKSGLIEKGEFVTWEATHFFIKQTLSTGITEMKRPDYFVDEMMRGAFKSMWHKHSFQREQTQTIMKDEFRYEVPLAILGKWFDQLILKNYMTNVLKERNEMIKRAAETEDWKTILSQVVQ